MIFQQKQQDLFQIKAVESFPVTFCMSVLEEQKNPLYPTPQDPMNIINQINGINANCKPCVATLSYDENVTLRYIEQHKPLTNEHITLFNQLRQFIDDTLSKKIAWKLSNISPKLLQIVDVNYKHHDESIATDDMYEYLQSYATTEMLIACCIGSNYNIEIAKQCILDIVQFRVCSRIDSINPEMFKNSLQTGSTFNCDEYDKAGHPICHFKILQTPPKDSWTIVRAAVFAIEKAIKLGQKNNLYQILWLIDLNYLSYSTMPPMEVIKEVSNLMTYYYPERLHKAYMLFTPWIFSAIFKMLTPILPKRTQEKIVNPGWYQSEKYETFKHDIDKQELVKKYGGDNDKRYSYQWEVEEWNKLYPKQQLNENEEKEDEKDDNDDNDNDNDDDSKLCIVCLDGFRDHVLIPCGHIAVCGQCKELYEGDDSECPLCRTKVEMVVKTFN